MCSLIGYGLPLDEPLEALVVISNSVSTDYTKSVQDGQKFGDYGGGAGENVSSQVKYSICIAHNLMAPTLYLFLQFL